MSILKQFNVTIETPLGNPLAVTLEAEWNDPERETSTCPGSVGHWSICHMGTVTNKEGQAWDDDAVYLLLATRWGWQAITKAINEAGDDDAPDMD